MLNWMKARARVCNDEELGEMAKDRDGCRRRKP